MSQLSFTDTRLPGVTLVRRAGHADGRGIFSRIFCARELAQIGWHTPVAQINHSVTRQRGTVRGLHFQTPPHAEAKLVSCLHGRVWDVVVDLRSGSPGFLQWFARELSQDDPVAMLVPEGCAHGFQALSDDAQLLYCHSMPYAPDSERGLHPNDPLLAIRWPLPVRHLSARDAAFAMLGADFAGVSP